MRDKSKTYYPRWVKPRHLLIGDVCYRWHGGEWKKFLFTGRQWIQEDIAPPGVKKTSRARSKYMHHNEGLREA